MNRYTEQSFESGRINIHILYNVYIRIYNIFFLNFDNPYVHRWI